MNTIKNWFQHVMNEYGSLQVPGYRNLKNYLQNYQT